MLDITIFSLLDKGRNVISKHVAVYNVHDKIFYQGVVYFFPIYHFPVDLNLLKPCTLYSHDILTA